MCPKRQPPVENTKRNPPRRRCGRNAWRIQNPVVLKKESRQSKSFSSSKNSFALPRPYCVPPHCPETSWAEPQRKTSLPFSEKIGCAQIRKARNIFLWGCGARRWRGFRSLRIFDKIGSSEVVKTLQNYQYATAKWLLIGLQFMYNHDMPNPKKPRPNCPICRKEPARSF